MTEALEGLTGAERAAIFLLSLGEQGAAAVMKHMAPKEVQQVGKALTNLSDVSDDKVSAVVGSFSEQVGNVSALSLGTDDFTRRVMVQALGEDRGRSMISQVMQEGEAKGIESLRWMDARNVAKVIGNEHEQIIAIVLASIDDDQAAQVLSFLPEAIRPEVILRIARLELIDPAALSELDTVLEKQLGETQHSSLSKVDGLNAAAGILSQLDSDQEAVLMESIKAADEALGDEINEKMFVFDNLSVLDDRGMQRLIRDIAVDSLVVALKGVDSVLQEKFFKNMSSRAADMLKEDMEAKGPVKITDVENAQKEILIIAMRLSDDGEIFMGKGGDADFV